MKMKKRLLVFVLAALLAFGGMASLVASAAAEPIVPHTAGFATEIVRLVNAERARGGLPAVSGAHPALNNAAQRRAVEIVTRFAHTRPNGRNWYTVLDEFNIFRFTGGENLAVGQTTPAEVVSAWMASAGHRANIMRADFNFLGIGIHESGGRLHWVQLFIQDTLSTYAADTLRLINAERTRAGLGALSATTNLSNAAQQRAVELSTNFQATRPNGAAWTTILTEFNISASRSAISVARGRLPAAELVRELMANSGARANILGNFNRLGVGVELRNGELFFALIFIQGDDADPPPETTTTTRPPTTTTRPTTTAPPNDQTFFGRDNTFINWLLFFLAFGWIWMWFV